MARLRREFDLVLIDGSPLSPASARAVLHRSVDAAVLVHNRSLTGQRACSAPARSSTPAASRCWAWPRRSSEAAGRLTRPGTRRPPLYEAHFGLTRRPFGETVDPSAYVALPSRDAVAATAPLRARARPGARPAVRAPRARARRSWRGSLARDLGGPSVHLTFPAMPAAELLALLADGARGRDRRPIRRWAARSVGLRRHLAASAARGERPLLIVDEAHLIDDPSTFEALRLLLNFASHGRPDLSLLLVGGAPDSCSSSSPPWSTASPPAACSGPSRESDRPPTSSAGSRRPAPPPPCSRRRARGPPPRRRRPPPPPQPPGRPRPADRLRRRA